MRSSDPGLAAIRQALEDYELTTIPADATPAGRTARIAEYLVSAGYAIRPRRGGLLRIAPRGSDTLHVLTYTAAVASMTSAIHLGWVQLWAPAAGLIVCAAFFADMAHRQHLDRTTAAAVARAARPKDTGEDL